MNRRFGLVVLSLLIGCGSSEKAPLPATDAATTTDSADTSDAHIPSAAVGDLTPRECTNPQEAPLLVGDGSWRCEVVGANMTPATSEWPDTSSAPGRVVFVRAGATGGNGTKDLPFGDFASALASTPAPQTIVLARGTHAIAAQTKITAPLTIMGTGANGTSLAIPAGVSPFVIDGTAAKVAMSGVAITYPTTGCVASAVAIDVTTGADVTLSDVAISGAGDAVRAAASKVQATGLSALAGCNRGVALLSGSTGQLTKFLVRDGKQIGVVVDDSTITASKGQIILNGARGLIARGSKSGIASKLDALAIQCNELTGLTVDGAVVEGSLITVSDARASSSGGGDGIVVRGGGSLTLDAKITSDADRGFGSQIVVNKRAGIVVTDGSSTAKISGAVIASNNGPGAFVQNGASATIGYSRIRRNVGVGVAVTTASSIVAIQCNELEGSRAGSVTTSAGTLSLLGDALSLSEGSRADTVMRNDMSRNDGFAVLLVASSGTLTQNTGTCNGFPAAGYDGAKLSQDDPAMLPGNAPAPTSTPAVAKGTLALP